MSERVKSNKMDSLTEAEATQLDRKNRERKSRERERKKQRGTLEIVQLFKGVKNNNMGIRREAEIERERKKQNLDCISKIHKRTNQTSNRSKKRSH